MLSMNPTKLSGGKNDDGSERTGNFPHQTLIPDLPNAPKRSVIGFSSVIRTEKPIVTPRPDTGNSTVRPPTSASPAKNHSNSTALMFRRGSKSIWMAAPAVPNMAHRPPRTSVSTLCAGPSSVQPCVPSSKSKTMGAGAAWAGKASQSKAINGGMARVRRGDVGLATSGVVIAVLTPATGAARLTRRSQGHRVRGLWAPERRTTLCCPRSPGSWSLRMPRGLRGSRRE